MATTIEQSSGERESSRLELSDAERQKAAISMAEVALRRRWTEKFRNQELVKVLEALDLAHPKES